MSTKITLRQFEIEAAKASYPYGALVVNAISLNMVADRHVAGTMRFRRVTAAEVADELGYLVQTGAQCASAIGHPDTAAVVAGVLGSPIPHSRVSVEFAPVTFVAQYIGPRLPEGAKMLPDGARVEFFRLEYDGRTAGNLPSIMDSLYGDDE